VQAQEIAFEHADFATVCAKAKSENKLVFIDFYTSWCGPCKHMAETVFKQDNVGQYMNSHFISYKVDAEKGEGKTLANRYQVRIYPTYLFLDDKGAVYNETCGSCADTVFLGIAAKGLAEYINPVSLPRLKAQYATHKKDTAFLRQYIEKLVENNMHAFEPIEQYLSVQTGMLPGSPEMMAFILKYPRQLYYGGRAAQIFEKYGDSFRKIADSGQRWQMELISNGLPANTLTYAIGSKNETILKRYIAAGDRKSHAGYPAYASQGIWLDFYSATGNWKQYRPLAQRLLDSLSGQLQPIAANPGDGRMHARTLSPEEINMRRAAFIAGQHAKIYFDHFRDEKDVLQKAMRWTKAVLSASADNPQALTFYANLLYLNKDTANAISTKLKALNSMPAISLHRNIVQTNLAHMQHGEMLEEE
jgi:thiol-disulfide isomerase/thioredoxin